MTANPPVSSAVPAMASPTSTAVGTRRFHVHMAVADLEANIRFYSALFAAEPTVTRDDYAKWMLDDPRINFAISTHGADVGIEHLGIQVESDDALTQIRDQAAAADLSAVAEIGTSCCYAKSDKYWLEDPQGVAWETFHSLDTIPTFNGRDEAAGDGSACCIPADSAKPEQAEAPEPSSTAAGSSCAPKSGCC